MATNFLESVQRAARNVKVRVADIYVDDVLQGARAVDMLSAVVL